MACTCVATEFHHHTRDDFAIEVEYFGLAEFRDQLSELLQAYRLYHHCIANRIDLEPGVKEKHDIARDTFQAAFTAQLRGNEQFLLDWAEDNVLDCFLIWTGELCPPLMQDAAARSRKTIVVTADDCSQMLMGLASELDQAGASAIWPFVKKIKFVAPAVTSNVVFR